MYWEAYNDGDDSSKDLPKKCAHLYIVLNSLRFEKIRDVQSFEKARMSRQENRAYNVR